MSPRILERRHPSAAPGQDPFLPGADLHDARLLGATPPALESPATGSAPARYRVVLSCSYDEEAPSPKPE